MKPLYLIFALVLFIACSTPPNKQDNKNTVLVDNFKNAYSSGEWEQTLFYLDTLKALGIDLQNVIPIKAECYAGLGKYDNAISILEKEIELDTMPDIHYIYKTLGDVLYLKGDIEKAISAYENTIDIRPSYARPYVNLGELYLSQGNKQQSVDYFVLAIRLFVANEFYAEVIEFSGKVLSIDPVNVEAYKYLQYALYELQQYNDALSIGLELDSILESDKQWNERHENWLFTGMAAFRCKDYQLSYDLIGNSMQFDDVKKEYGWLGFSYLSAICTKQGKEELAKEYADVAKNIGEKIPDEFIKELLNE